MKSAADIFVHSDELDGLPEPNRRNYLFELNLLVVRLPQGAKVLQVGSMDGVRIIRLLRQRPDLKLTGLEIEEELVELARRNVEEAGLKADFIHGDITQPSELPTFDWVICLNHTLGYIADQEKAVAGMRQLGRRVLISVYGEKFDERLAKEYFDVLQMPDYESVRRYSRSDVDVLGGAVRETPIGYTIELTGVGKAG